MLLQLLFKIPSFPSFLRERKITFIADKPSSHPYYCIDPIDNLQKLIILLAHGWKLYKYMLKQGTVFIANWKSDITLLGWIRKFPICYIFCAETWKESTFSLLPCVSIVEWGNENFLLPFFSSYSTLHIKAGAFSLSLLLPSFQIINEICSADNDAFFFPFFHPNSLH